MSATHSPRLGNSAITRIAVAGNGFEAWLAINHILAAFAGKHVDIKVCRVPGSDALDELYAVLPAGYDADLASIGISSNILARTCGASLSLGARVAGQPKPYGRIGQDFLGLPFHHHWLRAFPDQGPAEYFNWSPASLAIEQNAFAPPKEQGGIDTPGFGMAYHADIGKLTSLLRERATRHGVKVSSGTLAVVNRSSESDRISSLVSDQDEVLEADLYLDCSGPQCSLIRGAAGKLWVAARDVPEFYIRTKRLESSTPPPPCHQLSVHPEGWELEIPGPGWVSRISLSRTETGTDHHRFTPGHQAKPWIENCVGLGNATAMILPVEPVHFRYLSRSIRRLLNLLPGKDCAPRETAEYNHLALTDLKDLHDLSAVYELARLGSDLDLSARQFGSVHASLEARLALFAKRGRITPGDSDILEPGQWAAALILLGLLPKKHDRLVDRISLESLRSALQKLRAQIESTPQDHST